jgi:hypothetical protein
VFENAQDFVSFFDKLGFTTEFHKYSEMINELSSPKTLGVSESDVNNILSGADVMVLRLKERK